MEKISWVRLPKELLERYNDLFNTEIDFIKINNQIWVEISMVGKDEASELRKF